MLTWTKRTERQGRQGSKYMAKLRSVNTHFWSDNYVAELDPIEKLLFLYLITNPLTTLAGCYEISERRIAFDTGIDKDMVIKILGRFQDSGKLVYRDGWVLLTNFLSNQSLNDNMRKNVLSELDDAPKWVSRSIATIIKSSQSLSKGFEPFRILREDEVEVEVEEEVKKEGKKKEKRSASPPSTKKGTRLSEPFLLTPEMRIYAADKRPDIDVTIETEKFCNYWRAKPGNGGLKLDWLATWRNWILNARSNGNGTYHKSNVPHRPTSTDRIAEHIDIINQYPTEAELRDRARTSVGNVGGDQ